MSVGEENIRLQKIITATAILLVVIKMVAWLITGSLAILTDAFEGVVNIFSGLLGLFSLSLSERPKDADHPYGHGKVEFISAAIEGILIAGAGIFIIYKSTESFIRPHQISKIDMGILLVGISGMINYLAGVACVRKGMKNNSLPLISGGQHLKSDSYSTSGIIIGLTLIYFTGITYLDGVVSIIFATIILFTSYRILRVSLAGIMDEADIALLSELVDLLNKNRQENWIDLHNMRIIKYGSKLHFDCHVTLPWYFNLNEAHVEIDRIANLIRDRFGTSIEFFIHTDGCKEFSCRLCCKSDCIVRLHPFEKKLDWTIQNISKNSRHKFSEQEFS